MLCSSKLRHRGAQVTSWSARGLQNWLLGPLWAPKLAPGRALGLQIELLNRLWTAKLASWSALGLQVELLKPLWASKCASLGLQDASKSLQVWPKRRFGRPKAAQKAPQRAQVDSKKHSKGSPRPLERRKERNCKIIYFTM